MERHKNRTETETESQARYRRDRLIETKIKEKGRLIKMQREKEGDLTH